MVGRHCVGGDLLGGFVARHVIVAKLGLISIGCWFVLEVCREIVARLPGRFKLGQVRPALPELLREVELEVALLQDLWGERTSRLTLFPLTVDLVVCRLRKQHLVV